MDLKERIHAVMNANPLAALATVTEDGRPWVRYIIITAENDLSIKFATLTNSRKVAQISRNPAVHLICGASSAGSMTPYLQIEGKAKTTRDEAIRNRMWTDTLKKYFTGPDDPNYCVGIIEPCRIELFTTGQAPEVWEAVKK